MIGIALSGVLAHKARLALTSVAIMLGVAFVAGSLVFTDTIQARFETLFDDVYAGVDVTVRAQSPDFGGDVTDEAGAFSASLVDDVLALPESETAEGYLRGFGQVIDADGVPVGGNGPPTYLYSWISEPALNPFTIGDGDGREPSGPGELVLDVATADRAGYRLGADVPVQLAGGTETFTLVGVASFGESNNLAGATISVVSRAQAERLLGMRGEVTNIDIAAAEGIEPVELVDAVALLLPPGTEVVTGSRQTAEAVDGFTEGMGFMTAALLGFAGVSVLVGAFIIANTFRIIVAQRTRELALLRALGASARQVVSMVLVEAVAVALLASAVGVVLGVGLAELIKAGMGAVGFGPPDGPLTLTVPTVLLAMGVGVLVTVAAAAMPAVRASRVAPVTAMSATGTPAQTSGSARRRRVLVPLLGVGAAAAVVLGLARALPVVVGIGAVAMLAAVLMLTPAIARPVTRVLGWPLRGVAGRLARENAGRDPRRTAATASALTVGIALVVFTAIFAASTKDSVTAAVEDSFTADLNVASSNVYLGVSPKAQRAVADVGEVATTSAVRGGPALVGGEEALVTAVDPTTVDEVFVSTATVPLSALGSSAKDGLVVDEALVEDGSLSLGARVPVAFPDGAFTDLFVAGTHDDAVLGSYVIGQDVWERLGGGSKASSVFVVLDDGVALPDGDAAVTAALAGFPSLLVSTASEQVAAAEGMVDAMLVLFTGLLMLALLIAVLGIANTLALSVVERTREIGLLRAVGMSRGQVRWMVTHESVMTAMLGAVVGSVLGVGLGWLMVQTFAAQGLSTFTVPGGQLVLWLFVAAVAGVLAAALPARKAARLDVLAAVSYE